MEPLTHHSEQKIIEFFWTRYQGDWRGKNQQSQARRGVSGWQNVLLATSAGGERTDLTHIHGNRSWNKDKKQTDESAELLLFTFMTWCGLLPFKRALIWIHEIIITSPSLSREAEPPLCLQRGSSSCGSMGSAQKDMVLALSRGLCCPAIALLSASSCSLLTASREKDNPFSWNKEIRTSAQAHFCNMQFRPLQSERNTFLFASIFLQ